MRPLFVRCSRLAAPLLLAAIILPGTKAEAESLTVRVSGVKGSAGTVQVMLWKDAAGFPMHPEKALARKAVPAAAGRVDVVFSGLAAGEYAVAAYQDANGNGKLDRSLFGWPVEPVGASNGATGVMGPPKFADAAFRLKQPSQSIELVLK